MRLQSICTTLQMVGAAFAYTISSGTVGIDSHSVSFGEVETQQIKQLPIESPKDKISIALKLKDELSQRPHQLVLSLGSVAKQTLTTYFVPTFSDNEIKLVIPVNKLPEILKVQEKLQLKLTIADDSEHTLVKNLVEILPSAEFRASIDHKTPEPRLGAKAEIHHIFREDPATIGGTIPVLFIVAASLLLVGLIVVWLNVVGFDLFANFNNISTRQLLYNIAFLTSLVGFEANFVKYYLGQSIFTTLFNSFIAGLPAIYFGSKVLRWLGVNRKVGKF